MLSLLVPPSGVNRDLFTSIQEMSHNTAVPDVGGAVQWEDELILVDTVVPWT